MLDVKNTLAKLLNETVLIKTYFGTWDRFVTDGYGGYIDNTTIGIDDLTKYYWFIAELRNWAQRVFIQEVSSTSIIFRAWQISGTTSASVNLMRNTKPSNFRLVGIRKVGGVLLNSIFKAFSDFTSHLFGGDVDETETERNAGSADKADNIHSSRFFTGNREHSSREQYDLYSTSANIAYANSYLRILVHKLDGSLRDIQHGLLDREFYCERVNTQLKFSSSKQCETDTVFSLRSLAISERGWAV